MLDFVPTVLDGGVLGASVGPYTAADAEAHRAFGPKAAHLEGSRLADIVMQAALPLLFADFWDCSRCADFVHAVFDGDVLSASAGPYTAADAEAHGAFGPEAAQLEGS